MEAYSLLSHSLILLQATCVILVSAYLITRSRHFAEVLNGHRTWKNQLSLIFLFGAISVYGSVIGISYSGAVISVRDLGPLAGGLACGPIVGLGAGLIGGGVRMIMGGFTANACSLATVLAGVAGGLIYLRIRRFPGTAFSVALAALFELFHMVLALALSRPFSMALDVVETSIVPMVLANAGGMLVFAYIVTDFIAERENKAEKERIQRELDRERAELAVAADIQKSFLPEAVPKDAGFDLAIISRPARVVGGDFYDFIPWHDCLGVVVADVSGKGVPAAIFMGLAKTILRASMARGKDLAEVLRDTNNIVVDNSRSMMFITLFLGLLDRENRTLTYANAGHFPPLLFRAKDRAFEKMEVTGVALGMAEDMEYREQEIALFSGDILVLYTDGVTDAEGAGGEMFGQERLASAVSSSAHLSSQEILDRIVKEVFAFSAGKEQFDDLTAMVIKV
jgi:sigma-B regulation protein RsbU (phosphoserine phosphatase)